MRAIPKSAGLLPKLRSFGPFQGIDEAALQWLIDKSEYKRYDTGESLFYSSQPVNHILRNARGYVKTGKGLMTDEQFPKKWKREREPFLLETCQPGIFAAGDVRSGAMNRVASAVGEGAKGIKGSRNNKLPI